MDDFLQRRVEGCVPGVGEETSAFGVAHVDAETDGKLVVGVEGLLHEAALDSGRHGLHVCVCEAPVQPDYLRMVQDQLECKTLKWIFLFVCMVRDGLDQIM